MSSGTTAQDPTWASREQGEEARYIREKEQAQLAALREEQINRSESTTSKDDARDNVPKHSSAAPSVGSLMDRDFEGGFGGQEDLEDRYATTSGEH